MKQFGTALLILALIYRGYALCTFPMGKAGRKEVDELRARLPTVWTFAPIRFFLWVVLLPISNLFEGLLFAILLFSLGGLLCVLS
jgi:hypothetical protein